MLPPGASAPVPAVIFLHGSGPATRAGARPYAEQFARLGVASLFFDKRGSGSSGGSWETSSLEDLAGDALAALRYLKGEPRIQSSKIGFWGVSQAAWVATLAASRSTDVAFMMLISGGGASPRESEIFSYAQAFEQAGLSDAEKAEGFAVLEDYFGYLATGERRAHVVSRLEGLAATRLKPLGDQLARTLPSGENWRNWSWVATWDPAAHIAALKRPILLLFGDRDTDHPTPTAIERWRDGLAKAGNDSVTVVVFPGAGHGIRIRGESGRRFADGYAEVQLGWLWMHVLKAGEARP
jgi:pimeloyl-ACP methyl ester carboxylesterase